MTGSENQIGREMVTYSSFNPLEFLIVVEQVHMRQEQEQIFESQPQIHSDQTTDITLFTPTGETMKNQAGPSSPPQDFLLERSKTATKSPFDHIMYQLFTISQIVIGREIKNYAHIIMFENFKA